MSEEVVWVRVWLLCASVMVVKSARVRVSTCAGWERVGEEEEEEEEEEEVEG
jgi:hypothetical protein